MASLRLHLLLFTAVLLLSCPFNSADWEDTLLQGINAFRTAHTLKNLEKNDKADCVAEGIADKYFDKVECNSTRYATTLPQFSSYPNALTKCNININETTDAVILPSCKTSVLSSLTDNYTQTQYAKYLNNSKYTGYGIGSEDNWIIVVLSTSTASGDFTSQNAGTVLHQAGMVYYLVFLLFGVLFVFI